MATYGIAGDLYFGAITGATGTSGTKITNIDGHFIDFTIAQSAYQFKAARAKEKIITFYNGPESAVLIVAARDVSAAALSLLYGDLESSGGVQSNQTTAGSRAQARAIIVRPRTAAERFLYIPNAVIRPLEEVAVNFSVLEPFLDEQSIAFTPDRDTSNTEPAWIFDTSAKVNAAYVGLT